ncbi:MAG: AAA family ATPase [Desulfosalsimonadaceae bacterium]
MYRAHFGFTIKPFQINADPRFLWLGEKHTEALSVLKYGVLENRGFLLLTGDVGTGKTTLLNALLQGLDKNVLVARLPDPRLELIDFINILAGTLNMNETFQSRGPFLVRFGEYLQKQHYLGKTVLLIIDEAQRLTFELLEEIRALSNLEKPDAKFLNVFFVGQDEFNDMLLDYRSRAIRQRITLSYQLKPLSKKEVGEYIWHRQKVAGGQKNLFSKRAVDLIYEFSEGFPRLINIICDHALLSAYAGDKKFISDTIIYECARDLEVRSSRKPTEQIRQPGPATPPENQSQQEPKERKPKPRKAMLTALIILFFLLLAGYGAFIQTEQSTAPHAVPPESAGAPETQSDSRAAESAAEAETKAAAPEQAGRPGQANTKQSLQTPQTGVKAEIQNSISDNAASPEEPEAEKTPPVTADTPQVPAKPLPATAETFFDAAEPKAHDKLVVYFLSNTYEPNRRSTETLDKAKQLLISNPELKANVVGYTDSLGDKQYNLHLSEVRANIVKSYLSGNGVEAEQIEAKGLGSQNPMRSNKTREGRALNRRVEIVFEYTSQQPE